MNAIISGFDWLINFLKDIWEFIGSILSGLTLAFQYVFYVIDMSIDFILNMPSWLQAFGIISITICGVYFVIGRQAGKSD